MLKCRGAGMLVRFLVSATTLTLPSTTVASPEDNFLCVNRAAEIRCGDGTCEMVTANDGFTPMQLTRTGDTLRICAYSGCWSGMVASSAGIDGVVLVQAVVKRDGGGANGEEATLLSVLHDRSGGTAQMLWNGFANVMECGAER